MFSERVDFVELFFAPEEVVGVEVLECLVGLEGGASWDLEEEEVP